MVESKGFVQEQPFVSLYDGGKVDDFDCIIQKVLIHNVSTTSRRNYFKRMISLEL